MQYRQTIRSVALMAGMAAVCGSPVAAARDEFPQFRGMSGFPGSMFPVTMNGRYHPHGALSISTPTAYPLAQHQFVVGVSVLSRDGKLRYETKSRGGVERGNGSAQFMAGLPIADALDVSASYMVLSSIGDGALNVALSPRLADPRWRFAWGLQDMGGGGGARGVGQPGEGRTSRSFFAVVTGQVSDRIHASVGTGTRRFEGVFANASMAFAPNWNAALEFDTFGWNIGVAHTFDLGRSSSHPSAKASVFLGWIEGRKAVWGVNVGF